jgi:hypothetical protein
MNHHGEYETRQALARLLAERAALQYQTRLRALFNSAGGPLGLPTVGGAFAQPTLQQLAALRSAAPAAPFAAAPGMPAPDVPAGFRANPAAPAVVPSTPTVQPSAVHPQYQRNGCGSRDPQSSAGRSSGSTPSARGRPLQGAPPQGRPDASRPRCGETSRPCCGRSATRRDAPTLAPAATHPRVLSADEWQAPE